MTEQKAVSLCAVVRGRVQAVGFRDFVCVRARALGLTGYVHNLPDNGAVEVVAEGQRSGLEQLLVDLGEGPRLSHVEVVESEWDTASGTYEGFGVTF